jgi:hypothetical protein
MEALVTLCSTVQIATTFEVIEFNCYVFTHKSNIGLADTIREFFGSDILLYTTDPPHAIATGSLYGYSNAIAILDFRPGANLTEMFALQRLFNEKGRAPPSVTEW